MTKTRTIDNTNRPARPEPGEDEGTQAPEVREDAGGPAAEEAKQKERERQTGE